MGKCLNPHHETSGICTSGFCGTNAACCEKGIFGRPPCDGHTMGCDGHRCCVPLPALKTSPAHTASVSTSVAPPAPPPWPPLSECAIARVTYEIGKTRHDAFGDKVFEVIVRVEPWRPGSIVKLTYHQEDLEGGQTLIETYEMVGRQQ